MPQLQILISGAGIAGNALAFWLSKLDFCDVTVVEHFPNLRTTGLQIDLRGAGVDVLRRMGLEEAFRAKAAPEVGMQIVDKAGRARAYFPANRSGKGPQSFTSEHEILRGDLCRLMYAATGKERTRYLFGTSVESFEEQQNGVVEVRFGDGTTKEFDLVVGADGVGSRVRRLMTGCQDGGSDLSFHPLGSSYVAYFTIPRPAEEGEEYIAKYYIAPGHRSILTRRHNPDEIQVCLICRTESERLKNAQRGDIEAEKAAMDGIFRGVGWQADEILDAMKDATGFYCQRQGLVKMQSWSRGRAVLVGDAAYCPSTNGFGTSAAMVGAYILAGEIGRHYGRPGGGHAEPEGLGHALKAYEQELRPFMDKMQKAEESDRSFMPTSAFGISVVNSLLGVAATLRLHLFAMKFFHPEKGLEVQDYGNVLRV